MKNEYPKLIFVREISKFLKTRLEENTIQSLATTITPEEQILLTLSELSTLNYN